MTRRGPPRRRRRRQDYKSALQELLQSRELPLPEYRLAGTLGPDHRKLFQVEVVVEGEALAEATGREQEGSGAGGRRAGAGETAVIDELANS